MSDISRASSIQTSPTVTVAGLRIPAPVTALFPLGSPAAAGWQRARRSPVRTFDRPMPR